ncbi:MAG: efflux RND transporter periplasmic adaptor subunit [Bacteroidota bacterium]
MIITITGKLKCLTPIFFLLILGCGEEEKKEEAVLRPVKFAEATYLGGANTRQFSGVAKTEKIINLSFRSSGIITKLDVKLGQNVKKGQLLGTLDNVSARLSYEAAIESKNSAESQMNTTKLNLNRIRTLYEKGSASLSDYESAKNSYRTAVASFESSKRSVAIQQDQIQFGYLYASEDGTIASVASEVDENVSPGQIVAVLNAGSAIEISIGLPESVINNVEIGMPVEVSFTAIKDEKFSAKITEVAPSLNANTSTYPITLTVQDADERIKSGMAANAVFDFSENEEKIEKAIVVPTTAVGEDGSGRFVFKVENKADNAIVTKQAVEIGELTNEGFIIISGLSAGEKVAVAGLQTLLNGQEVRLN